jgi:formylglycine-generating enzyme required for sulfatase activity
VKDETFSLAPMPGGTFAMGETPDMGRYRTPSVHQVILDGYCIGTTEVSQALWKAVMGSNPSPKDMPAAPVTSVSYKDIQKFLKKLSKLTGVPFRLPTEAEWEYAARQRGDMVGNAWEWCSDRWTDDLGFHLTVNPVGTTEGEARALRGGSVLEKNNKPITRKAMAQTSRAGDVGFRLAVSTGEGYPADIYDVLVANKVQRESFEGTDFKNEKFTVGGVAFEMVAVEGGTFTMGGVELPNMPARDNELPLHDVTLDSFKIGRTEVTQALWEAVMGSIPYGNQGPDYPIGNVSWYDAQAFIRRLNALTGRCFRRPTEAEWEYAARGGKQSHGTRYSGSDNPNEVAWHQGNAGNVLHQPGSLRPNELGLYDMSGNIWEWCSDWYDEYPANAQTNPTVQTIGSVSRRVVRGGSFSYEAPYSRVSQRNSLSPNYRSFVTGFRVAIDEVK